MSDDLKRVDDIDDSFVPRARAGVASVVLDGEAVLLDEDTSAMHTLNPTATLVWDCFDGTGSIAEIVDDLVEAYPMDRAVVARDVLDLARQLGRQGLLEGVAPEVPPDDHHTHDHTHDTGSPTDHG